ncbi:subtilisin-like protease [Phtheirospermum japonicum]|uniref:Subtilisin-like protease n=1 Tax=Phtheirospermum japonicum TaxID=374723 RepID=A0A830BEA7_9LAMI|nr:subtilisin-like protease [Phtheirospermum japonicum]
MAFYPPAGMNYAPSTTHSPQFLGLRKGQGLWSARNLGSDVIIGLVDTGIWPEHPSFSDSGLSPVPRRWKGKCQGTKFTALNCNRKLIDAAAFLKLYESAVGRIDETSDYRSAHSNNLVGGANIFGVANGTAADMRYTARIAAYKACYESGCMDSDILAAMEQTVEDGVDVLSISLGGQPMPYYKDIMAIGAFGAIKKGVIVSTAAGNSGLESYTVTNVAPWSMTVAASSTDRSLVAQLRLGDGKIFSGASLFSGKPTKQLPLSDHQVYNTSENAMFCNRGSLSPALVKGKIVICVVGGDISIVGIGEVVKAAGGAGMILANDVDQGEDTIADAHVLPAVWLGASEAKAVISYTKSSKNPTARIESAREVYGNRAPVMASFSSRGPNSVDSYILKPDVTAPGVNILAAWPTNVSPTNLKSDKRRVSFNVLSGTSMSCPHVSGLIALLKSLQGLVPGRDKIGPYDNGLRSRLQK